MCGRTHNVSTQTIFYTIQSYVEAKSLFSISAQLTEHLTFPFCLHACIFFILFTCNFFFFFLYHMLHTFSSFFSGIITDIKLYIPYIHSKIPIQFYNIFYFYVGEKKLYIIQQCHIRLATVRLPNRFDRFANRTDIVNISLRGAATKMMWSVNRLSVLSKQSVSSVN